MAVFEVESFYVTEGLEAEYDAVMRDWLEWINAHRELFPELNRPGFSGDCFS